MKVILNSYHGILTLPTELFGMMESAMKHDGECWIYNKNLIKAIEELPAVVVTPSNIGPALNELKSGKIKLIKFCSDNETVYWINLPKDVLGGMASFTIKDVDVARRWTIREDNGIQTIFYIDDIYPIDRKNNFYGGLYK